MSPHPEPHGETDKGPPSDEDEEPIENMPMPQFVINDANSESEDEEGENGEVYYGYQMLPQDPEEVSSDVTDSNGIELITDYSEPCPSDVGQSSEASGHRLAPGVITDSHQDTEHELNKLDHPVLHQNTKGTVPGYMQTPDPPKPDSKELLWNKQRSTNIAMEQGQVEKVKAVMSTITLPPTNIPDWAKDISEDKWREKLTALHQTHQS